jgi:hypothetical protein
MLMFVGGDRGRMVSMVFIFPVWQQGQTSGSNFRRWRHTSCQVSLGGGVVSEVELFTSFPCKMGSSADLRREDRKPNINIKMKRYLCNASSVVLHGAFAALTKGKRSFESLISLSKTRHGSAGFGDDGFASGAETSAVFLCVHRIKFLVIKQKPNEEHLLLRLTTGSRLIETSLLPEV